MVAAKLSNMPKGRLSNSANLPSFVSQASAGEKLNVSTRSVTDAAKVQDKAAPEVVARVERGSIPVSVAAKVADMPMGGAVYRSANLPTDTVSQVSAADMLDKAAAIAAYARQRKDVEVDVWMTEIRRRAEIRIGELSRELDKAPTRVSGEITSAHSEVIVPKAKTLADAGISTSTAHEYEQLTGGADARGEAAAAPTRNNPPCRLRKTRI